DERDGRGGEERDGRDAEGGLDERGIGCRPDDAVDVGGGEPALAQHGDARLQGVRRLRAWRVLGGEAGGGRPGDGDLVLHGVAVRAHGASSPSGTSRNTGIGAPPRSTQSSRTRRPIAISALSAPTTVDAMRTPGCPSRSARTT